MKSRVDCIACGSQRLAPLDLFSHAFLVECSRCKMIFSSRLPSQAELSKHYEGYALQPYLSPITVTRYKELLDTFEPFRKLNRLLDIGCGPGFLLAEAKSGGWEAYGTELNTKYVSQCTAKGIVMTQGSPDAFGAEWFDVITAIELLEHVTDPAEELRKANRWLKKRGLFYFTTPNFSSLDRLIAGGDWSLVEYPEHLSYFTPETVHRMLRTAGFEKIRLRTTGISITRMGARAGQPNEAIVTAASADERLRVRIENHPLLRLAKTTVNGLLSWTGKGNTIKGWYRKTAR